MPSKLELLQEAAKRGILPENKIPLYDEAVKRNLIEDVRQQADDPIENQELPGTHTDMSNAIISQFNQGQAEPKPFEQVADLGQGHIPGDGKPREGSELASKIARPILSTTGIIGGSAIGTGTGGPGVGTVAGGALGYGIGESAANKFDEFLGLRDPQSLKDETLETAQNVKTGAEYIAGGEIIGPIVGPAFKKGIDVVSKTKTFDNVFRALPEKLYKSAAKMSTSAKWKNVLPGKEINKRNLATQTALSDRVGLNEYGLTKTQQLKKEAFEHIEKITDKLSENPNNKISVSEIIDTGLKKAYAKAKNSTDPTGMTKAVDEIADKFKAHGEYMTPKQANQVKREIDIGVNHETQLDKVNAAAEKGIRRQLMLSLEDMYPEIKTVNDKYAARKALEQVIKDHIAREENQPIVRITSKILAVHKWPFAVWDATIGHPEVKANLALLLAKANPEKYSKFLYPELPAGYTPYKAIKQEVYRYSKNIDYAKSPRPKKLDIVVRDGEQPVNIKTKAEIAKEREEYAKLKQIEQAFKEQERANGLKGSKLKMPKNIDYAKSPVVQALRIELRAGEPVSKIKTKLQKAIERDEAARIKQIEIKFNELNSKKASNGSPLTMPKKEFTKSPRSKSVADRLKEL